MLITRRHAGSVSFGHMNDAVVSDNCGLIINRQNSQIVSVEIFQLTIARAFHDFFLVMEPAFAAHEYEVISQPTLQEVYDLALLIFRNRLGIGNQRLLQRIKRLGRISCGLR